jgi:FkbM family methyltransferase
MTQQSKAPCYLGNGRILIETFFGAAMIANANDVSITPSLIRFGAWETHISLIMSKIIRPGMRCVDVGAHSGYYALIMAVGVGATGAVEVVEPNPNQIELIFDSLSINGLGHICKIHQVALGRSEARFEIAVPKRYTGSSSRSSSVDFAQCFDTSNIIEVQCKTLDSIVREPIDLIKIDTEGMELEVLSGGQHTLANPNIIVFCEVSMATSAKRDPRAYYQLIAKNHGFNILHIEYSGSLTLLNEEQFLGFDHQYCDMIFVRNLDYLAGLLE